LPNLAIGYDDHSAGDKSRKYEIEVKVLTETNKYVLVLTNKLTRLISLCEPV